MMDHDATAVALEVKFASGSAQGAFEGYGAVFGNADSHGDLILPGAFADSLAAKRAQGRTVPMYAMHGATLGGDPLPVGVWRSVEEDARGLKVAGEIAAMDTDHGRRIYGLVKSGALGGLSIGYRVPPGGAVAGTKAGEPKRTLKRLDLAEISLVDDPSNAMARVDQIKAAAVMAGDRNKAADAIASAMRLHDKSMRDGYSASSPKDKALLMDHLRNAHEALTGQRAPDGLEGWTKSARTIREFEELLREKGFTRSEATQIAERGFKSLPRDGGDEEAIRPEIKGALDEFRAAASAFTNPHLT